MTGEAVVPVFLCACALLVVAGAAKVRAPRSARGSLELIGIPVPLAAVRVLGVAELALGVYAAIRPGPLAGGLVAGAYGVFLLVTVRLLAVDASADCGCFGAASTAVSRAHAVACAAAGAVAALAAVVSPPGVQWVATRTPLVAVTLTLGTATAAFAAYAVFTLFAPAWSAYGSGRAE
jgi:hypothetical protein